MTTWQMGGCYGSLLKDCVVVKPSLTCWWTLWRDLTCRFRTKKAKSLETRVEEYLVPCMMKRVPREEKKDRNVPILFFKFAHRDFIEKERENERLSLPNGLFHRVVSRCCRTNKTWTQMATYYDYTWSSARVKELSSFCAWRTTAWCYVPSGSTHRTGLKIRDVRH